MILLIESIVAAADLAISPAEPRFGYSLSLIRFKSIRDWRSNSCTDRRSSRALRV